MRLTPMQVDAMQEVINIGAGRAAAALSELIGACIELSVPSIQFLDPETLTKGESPAGRSSQVAIFQDFEGTINGRAVLALPKEDGVLLAKLLGGEDCRSDDADLELGSILTEVGNIVLNGVLGSLANMMQGVFEYTVPECNLAASLSGLLRASPFSDEQVRSVLVADARFSVAEQAIAGELLIAFELGAIGTVMDSLNTTVSDA